MLDRDVAPGVHRIAHAQVNCYLIEGGDGLLLVDAGLPGVWHELGLALRTLGRRPEDLRALVLTHAHFDHVGVARRLVERLGIPVLVHHQDAELAAHPYRYAHENPRALYPLRHPRALPVLGAMVAGGAAWVRGIDRTTALGVDTVLDVPGAPRVIATPGHTYGHVALHLPDRDAVLTGDALVTLDPYTARTGPRIIAGAATADSAMALRSLDAIAGTEATTVLPGHGEVWHGGAREAAARTRSEGPA
ncbi:MBL fold metallo-hydrolase [Brachybacterium aquaticum]|uniref:Glyoxylase-like metal-dependent hydrolase (Beta-lactamase superfamily II) n=1 Tax=Brachybacterium aquaticum TaxID=1432564 RepID=A0A841AGD5_9MICO|nr:MBL fold metallo-hydrolase [Brachybacterium aquaticum]MBB5832987.1 glyoxylase-like metal-dependent hydrolase (beta-lactamase superfamily II) [Brachybacterium aquaticum]